jgi:hypothetical protein
MKKRTGSMLEEVSCVCALIALVIVPVSRGIAADSSEPSQTPNVVLLLVDDMGWGDLVCKRDQFEIPNIARLMADGMTFTDAYASSPCCSPSRASVTGLSARGGFEVSLEWKDGRLVAGEILSRRGNACTLCCGNQVKTFDTKAGGRYPLRSILEL